MYTYIYIYIYVHIYIYIVLRCLIYLFAAGSTIFTRYCRRAGCALLAASCASCWSAASVLPLPRRGQQQRGGVSPVRFPPARWGLLDLSQLFRLPFVSTSSSSSSLLAHHLCFHFHVHFRFANSLPISSNFCAPWTLLDLSCRLPIWVGTSWTSSARFWAQWAPLDPKQGPSEPSLEINLGPSEPQRPDGMPEYMPERLPECMPAGKPGTILERDALSASIASLLVALEVFHTPSHCSWSDSHGCMDD